MVVRDHMSSNRLMTQRGARLLAAVVAGLLAGPALPARAQPVPAPDGDDPPEHLLHAIRTIEFPEQGSLGEISVRPWKADQAHRVSKLGPAQGRLTIQPAQWVILRVSDVSDLAPLGKLHDEDLQELVCTALPLTDQGLEQIRGLVSMRRLDLSETRVTDAGLAALERFSELRRLNLHGTAVTDAGLAHIGPLAALRVVDLSSTGVTSAGLGSLSGLRHLRELRLNDTRVDDSGLSHLSGLPELEVLSLRSTLVTSQGLAALAALPALRHLVLRETGVDDAAVGTLGRLKQLQSLDVRETKLTRAAIQQLSAALGTCRIYH
jgi:Ran GTPase-activating protein (RanGAP) involved in mRNA processing and transport